MLLCLKCGEVFDLRPATKPVPAARPKAPAPVAKSEPQPAPVPQSNVAETRTVVAVVAVCITVVALLTAGIGVGIWLIADRVGEMVAKNEPNENPAPTPAPEKPKASPEKPKADPERPADKSSDPPPKDNPFRKSESPIAPTPPSTTPTEPILRPMRPVPSPGEFSRPPFGPPVFGPIPKIGQEPPEEKAGAGVPAFKEPANPYKPGTQTKLRELRSVSLPEIPKPPQPKDNPLPFRAPDPDHMQVIHSPQHQLLFVRNPTGVWVYDLKADKALGTQSGKLSLTDMSLSPDQSALFVADYGGEHTGYGTPTNPSRVHRFDMATRKWEERKAPKIAWRIEAVDSHRVLLLEQDQWVDVTLNKWEEDGVGIRELARTGCNYNGDIEYDPRTGRLYHGNRGITSPEINVRVVDGNSVKPDKGTGTYGSAGKGGGTVVLSQDGSRLYYGRLQVNAAEVGKNLETFPDLILAASRDIAFGAEAYYRATTGSKLGEFEFKTIKTDRNNPYRAPFGMATALPAIAVSPDGLSVWVIDRDKNVVRQFAIEGEK
jgi:hypothetical protein